jgi:outer membrane protein OmpA-like peptidoglycan-associated protein
MGESRDDKDPSSSENSRSSEPADGSQGQTDALDELLKEFELYQSDPEPIPEREEIEKMEEEERLAGESSPSDDGPSSPSAQDGSVPSEPADDAGGDSESSETAEEPVQDADQLNARTGPEVSAEQESPSGKAPVISSSSKADSATDDPPASSEQTLPPADNSATPATTISQPPRKESETAPTTPASHTSWRNSVEDHTPEERQLFIQSSQPSSGTALVNSAPVMQSHSISGSVWGALIRESLNFAAGLLESVFSIPQWRRRLDLARAGRPFREVLNPPSPNSLAQLKVFELQSMAPVLVHGRLDSASGAYLQWIADLESTAQVAWSDPEERNHPISKSGPGGHSSLILCGSRLGAVCHFRGEHNAGPEKPLVRVLNSAWNEEVDQPSMDPILDWAENSARQHQTPSIFSRSAVLLMVSVFAGIGIQKQLENRQSMMVFQEVISTLESEPGILVVRARQKNPDAEIHLLRDPLARNPGNILEDMHLANPVHLHSETYYSHEPEIVIRRLSQYLMPPEGVSMAMIGNRLVMSGQAPKSWIDRARQLAPFIPGVGEVDFISLEPEWSVDPVEINGLSPRQLLEARIRSITAEPVLFKSGKSVLAPGQHDRINQLASRILEISTVAASLDLEVHVHIRAYTTKAEYSHAGTALSRMRAESVKSFLTFRGIPERAVIAEAMGRITPAGNAAPGNSASVELTLHPEPFASIHADEPQTSREPGH